ncbi:hypothetical protein GCM10017786_19040 [Amycolatopsis deserti]|uniref:DUF3558 domain-containing protein n=1 Tax=Amycolatopsis deserti TaxID=185696 RepID=A0ABQ3INH3_9PSEU|nr:DUF3558 family protein [Amycolatopsis deserti]GHE87476.1 hypothetical protein GCM10017786_19040 [Amycolatopsis deserti]
MRGAVLVLAAGALLTACGQPASRPAAPVPSSPASASPSAPPAGLAGLKPCELLSTTDRSTAGLTSLGEEKTIGTARACDWTEPGTFGVTVTLAEDAPLASLEIDKGTGKRVTVGAHKGFRVSDRRAGDGTCAVLLGVGQEASVQVDVTNTGFADTPLACERADTVARLIEPKLP